jgi:hypothetical protein
MIVVLNFCFSLELLCGMSWNVAQTNGRPISCTYTLVQFLQALRFCSSKRPVDHYIVTVANQWKVCNFDHEFNGYICNKILYIGLFLHFCYYFLFSFYIKKYQGQRQFYVRVRLGLGILGLANAEKGVFFSENHAVP